jgi:membrane protein DedA with SNARE-associated domain
MIACMDPLTPMVVVAVAAAMFGAFIGYMVARGN